MQVWLLVVCSMERNVWKYKTHDFLGMNATLSDSRPDAWAPALETAANNLLNALDFILELIWGTLKAIT
jgi:hypothetical protein